MARPKKNNPKSAIRPLVDDFAVKLAEFVENFTTDRITRAIQQGEERANRRFGSQRKRPVALCYVPGCKNVAAPRFGMCCAAKHKELPKGKKLALRQRHHAMVMRERSR